MKKLFLLTIAGMISWGAGAQQISGGSVKFNQPADEFFGPVLPTRAETVGSTQKGTAGGSRWFSHLETITALNGSPMNGIYCPVWFDSTVKQRFNTGLGTINFSSFAQTLNPNGWSNSGYRLWADANVFQDNPVVVSGNPYTVDSIRFVGAYVKNDNRPTSVVDTLIVTVAQTQGAYYWRKSAANTAWAAAYIPSDKDTLWGPAPLEVDSINRTIGGTGRIMWKIPLTDADRDSAAAQGKEWALQVPNGGLSVPAGGAFSMSVTFKSGDTWTPNVDSFGSFHHFFLGSTYVADNANMIYKWYEYGDRNGSSLMFSVDSSTYLPSVGIEGTNPTANFRYEQHQMEARITCATCVTLSVDKAVGNIVNTSAYPNPAVTHVYVPFKLNNASDVTVSVTNALGQTVKSVTMNNVDKGQPEFNIADLANGLYFYVVEANGARSTGRIVVAH